MQTYILTPDTRNILPLIKRSVRAHLEQVGVADIESLKRAWENNQNPEFRLEWWIAEYAINRMLEAGEISGGRVIGFPTPVKPV